MGAVKQDLEWMEMLGVITKIQEPTEWCAGMVVVLKTDNKVWICADLTKLNQSIRHERHPLPAVASMRFYDMSLGDPESAQIQTKSKVSRSSHQSQTSDMLGDTYRYGEPPHKICSQILLRQHNPWESYLWRTDCGLGLRNNKELLTRPKSSTHSQPNTCTLFDPNHETSVSADASSFGLGVALIQKNPKGEYKPVAYISRSLTPPKQRYAQIEKELGAGLYLGVQMSLRLLDWTAISYLDRPQKPLVPLLPQTLSMCLSTPIQYQGPWTDSYSSAALSSSNDVFLIQHFSPTRKHTDHCRCTLQISNSKHTWWPSTSRNRCLCPSRVCQPQRTESSISEIANKRTRHAS